MSARPESVRNTANAKIVILTGASLSWNPRTLKEATALAHTGIEVVVCGSTSNQASFETDQALARRHGFRFESAMSVSRFPFVNRVRSLLSRAGALLCRDFFRATGIENRWQLGPLVSSLLRRAVAESADYYIVHLEQAAWVGAALVRQGKRVGIDMEDWF